MTDALLLPGSLARVLDANGRPVAGAKRYVFDAGTTSEKNVYTDATLDTAAANPIVADAGGYLPARYIGTGSYKIATTDANDVPIKPSEDNLPGALNTAPFEAAAAKPVTPAIATGTSRLIAVSELGSVVYADPTGGNVTITLPSPGDAGDGTRLTVIHTGTANSVLVEEAETLATLETSPQSVTLVSDATAWRVQQRYDQNVVNRLTMPQGYLTLVTDTPVITSDQASKTNVFYTPDQGDACPIFNGMAFVPWRFAELTVALGSQHLADNIYDVFVFLDPSDGKTVRIGTGPSWADGAVSGSVAAGSGARGTGAASTELQRVQGLTVNANEITARNGGTTYTVAANKATYVGSLFMDGSNGEITCHVSYGQSRKWGVWNAYNRRRLLLKAGDSTSSWGYSTATFRPSNNSAANSLSVFTGLSEELADLALQQNVTMATGGVTTSCTGSAANGIGWNSTTVPAGVRGSFYAQHNATSFSHGGGANLKADYLTVAALGVHVATSLEFASLTGMTAAWAGTEANMVLSAQWRG
jgi:hypothetical protein